jgi:hypothetical protein
MNTINLSEANIGDKFKTRCGMIVTFVGDTIDPESGLHFNVKDENDIIFQVHNNGSIELERETCIDLVEQVFDEPEPEPEPKPSFEIPKMDDLDKMGKDLMQTLKNQIGNISIEQRYTRRERIALAIIHIMGVEGLRNLVNDTAAQDNLKDLVDIVESVIGL